jgi:hypothetical protein
MLLIFLKSSPVSAKGVGGDISVGEHHDIARSVIGKDLMKKRRWENEDENNFTKCWKK